MVLQDFGIDPAPILAGAVIVGLTDPQPASAHSSVAWCLRPMPTCAAVAIR